MVRFRQPLGDPLSQRTAMTHFTTELFLLMLALISAVIVVASLLSGLVERSGLPQVAVFLALGATIGPIGLGFLDVGVNSPLLRVLATVSLALILFTDAMSLNISELKRHKLLSFLVVGPGTLLLSLIVAIAAWWLLDLSPAMAAILGAALASTDPVLLRGLLRSRGLDPSVKQALRLESGMNDAVLLPIVLVAMAVLSSGAVINGRDWGRIILSMLVLSPMAGIFIGLGAVGSLVLVRPRIGIRRDYESFYSLGVAFAAFAAGEALHGSGFLSAFFAGLTVSALDVELCDCFRDYGETTAELTLLFTFVLLGTSVIWSGLTVIAPATLLFAGAVFVARPAVFVPALLPVKLTRPDRALIAWFGPRGLSSLLLVLLPVFAGISGTEKLLPICCLVVLFSVVLHGLSPAVLLRHKAMPAQTETFGKQEPILPATGLAGGAALRLPEGHFITIDDLKVVRTENIKTVVLDVRSERDYNKSDEEIPGAIRLHPDRASHELERPGLTHDAVIVAVCSCPKDITSERVVAELRRAGWLNARALRDGWNAWKQAGLPIVPRD